VIAQRRTRAQAFFSDAAGRWDALREEMFGRSTDLAMLALLDEGWVVGDLGCGTGWLAARIAPFVRRVIGVDASAEMLDAARPRLEGGGVANVELRQGDLERLPLVDGELDVAVLALVLHYVAEPPEALAEVRRVLQPDGRLLVVDMMPHAHEEYRQTMGHLWLGFPEDRLSGWLAGAGFRDVRYRPLPADPQAKGPTLFVATARKR
jgi:ArsR family transcriptional regulator